MTIIPYSAVDQKFCRALPYRTLVAKRKKLRIQPGDICSLVASMPLNKHTTDLSCEKPFTSIQRDNPIGNKRSMCAGNYHCLGVV